MGRSGPKPDQKLTIFTSWSWISVYGISQQIQSDQGTHFTVKIIKRQAKKNLDIMQFLLAYNPTAVGSIERFNGLLKLKFVVHKDRPLSEALMKATFDRNSRPRINR
jgi:transposase InsO family protein